MVADTTRGQDSDSWIPTSVLIAAELGEYRIDTAVGSTSELDALIPAWRAGITKIITIPCQGTHNRRIGGAAQPVTDLTRADSNGYRHALALFD